MIMQVDDATWKRLTKRLAILEELAEIQAENTANIIRAIQLICKRLPRPAGSSDPFDMILVGPADKPAVLPPGLAEELNSPVWKWAVGKLSQEEADELHSRLQLIHVLRKMRSDREARKVSGRVSCVKSPGGGAPGASLPL